jgi:two-component system, OmpR family, response regulator MprA
MRQQMAEDARVLVIEDELRIAQFVSRGLGMDGYEVVVAEDGDVGVFLATTEPFDLVVLDVADPSAPWLEILERIRSAREEAPIIVLSEHDGPDARRACEVAGASAFLAKPLVVETLRAKVREQLARRHA